MGALRVRDFGSTTQPKMHRTEGKVRSNRAGVPATKAPAVRTHATISVKSNTRRNLFFSIGIEKRKHEQF
jgi:hypothetical protein